MEITTDQHPEGITVNITRAKFLKMKNCWTGGCECEQTKNPYLKMTFFILGSL